MFETTDRQRRMFSMLGAIALLVVAIGATGAVARQLVTDIATVRTAAAITGPARAVTGIVGAVRY